MKHMGFTNPICAAAMLALSAGCGGGSNDTVTDTAGDPQPDQQAETVTDVPVDTADALPDSADAADAPLEEAPAVRVSTCALSCSGTSDCCAAASCTSYPHRWSCDEICTNTGCLTNEECVSWATGLSLPGASGYKCWTLAGSFGLCVKGCALPADCCPSGADCTKYPNKYACTGGECVLEGCRTDGECQGWASSTAQHRPDLYKCREAGASGLKVCTQSCATPADCCSPDHTPCDKYPFRYDCVGGFCASVCTSNPECVDFATRNSLHKASMYVCHEQ